MTCTHCGQPFPADHPLNRYCSLECLCLHNAARVRAERLANVRLPYKETDMSDADPDVCYLCGNDEGDIEALIDGELTPVCARCALTLPEED